MTPTNTSHRIFPNIVATVGNTPLVQLQRVVPAEHATVLLKLEFFNPLSSVKDRVGCAMLAAAERDGILTPDTEIVEPTSGNTGIALAFAAAARNLRLTLVMPETMSVERRQLLAALGANLILTPGAKGMRGAIERANEIVASRASAWMPQQFENPANPQAHEATTGPEIWRDSGGRCDILVSAVGTGGTFTGSMRYLRSQSRDVLGVVVEPAASPVISGGVAGPHPIQGIGAGFVPKNLDTSLVDRIEQVTGDEAFDFARRLAREEGILVGISSGANVAVAARLAALPENRDKTIVTFAPSCGERYLSTPLFQPVR
ncbi:MAG: cysteine synthase A [Thermoguttaceae bacterium]